MRLLFVAIAIAASCTPARTPAPIVHTPPPTLVPGTAWVTPAVPFRTPRYAYAIAADGDEVLIGHADGYLTLIDLRTGARRAELVVPNTETTDGTSFMEVVALGDHRWVAFGIANPWELAYLVTSTATTLTATRLAEFSRVRGDASPGIPSLAVTDDGGVIITGDDLPLAIYDPQTFAVRRMIDERRGWANVSVRGTTLVAAFHRFTLLEADLTTGVVGDLHATDDDGHHASGGVLQQPHAAAHGRIVHPMRGEDGEHVGVVDGAKELAIPHTTPTVMRWLVDRAGERLYLEAGPSSEVRSIATGALERTIPTPFPTAFAVVRGDLVIGQFGDSIRTLDLATGALSAAPDTPPHAGFAHLAVDDGGGVLVSTATAIWRFVDGRLVETVALDAQHALASSLGDDPTRYVIGTGDHDVLHRFGTAAPIATWPGRNFTWLGAGTTRVVLGAYAEGSPSGQVSRVAGTATTPMFPTHPETHDVDVDVDADAALAITWSRIGVWRAGAVATTEPQPPTCHVTNARLERGGDRIVAWDEFAHVVALWGRDDKPLADATFGARLVDVAFVRGVPELVISTVAHEIVVWTPNGAARTLAIPHLARVAVSPDGRRLALLFDDARVALVDRATLVAAMPVGAPPPRAPPKTACDESWDPFGVIPSMSGGRED